MPAPMATKQLGKPGWRVVQSPLVVFFLAFAIRVWTASQLLPEKAGPFFYQRNEPARIAWAMDTGHGYSSPWPNTPLLPTAQQPPGYPIIVAGIFKVFGAYTMAALWAAVLLNAVFAGLTAIVILKIGRRDFGVSVGIVAAWVWACWLYEAAVSIRLWETALSALLLSVALWALPELAASTRASRWIFFGLLAGVAALTNTTLLAVFPFFWLWLWFRSNAQRQVRVRLVLLSVAVGILLMFPWTIRNHRVFHRFIPVRDNFGLEFWLGNHEGAPNGVQTDFPLVDPTEYNRLGEIEFMKTKGEIGFEFVRQHPEQFLLLCLRRVYRFWIEPRGSAWAVVSGLAWIGVCIALRRKPMTALPYLAILLIFPIVYYVTHTFPSYRHPMEPTMLILAVYVTVSVAEIVLGKLTGRVSVGSLAGSD